MNFKQYSKKGFTLLELIIVLVIISLISALVGPRFTGSLTSMNLKTAAKKVAAALRYARSQAASEQITYISVFDFEKQILTVGDYQQPSEDIHSDNIIEHIDKPETYQLPDGIKFEKIISAEDEINTGLFTILFYPIGNSTGGEIILTDEREKHYSINVDFITGSVQLN